MITTTKNEFFKENTNESSDFDGRYSEIKISDKELGTIRGFGGCFNELGYKALLNLSQSERDSVFNEFFSKEGLNFNFCRIPIGANDFSTKWYSHAEVENDFNMEYHTIQKDYEYLIPYIKEAQKVNHNIEFFASPWCPPTWMKTKNTFNNGTLRWEEDILKSYSLYLTKFIQKYEQEGINISQLHVQNEPVSRQVFPSCVWTGEEFEEFISKYLVETFKENKINTDIYLGTINGPENDKRSLYTRFNNYVNLVMQNDVCREYIRGVGYQWNGKHAVSQTKRSYPHLEIIQTESECGDGENTWEFSKYIFELIHHYLTNGASSYVYWNMVLDNPESLWGWSQNSLITIKDDKVIYNYELYIMKHFSHFIDKGDKTIDIIGEFNSNTICVKKLDGSYIFCILNPFKDTKVIKILDKYYKLKPNSVNTIEIDKY